MGRIFGLLILSRINLWTTFPPGFSLPTLKLSMLTEKDLNPWIPSTIGLPTVHILLYFLFINSAPRFFLTFSHLFIFSDRLQSPPSVDKLHFYWSEGRFSGDGETALGMLIFPLPPVQNLPLKQIETMAGNCHCECPETTQWLKGKLVGAGSFGRVYLAMDIATGGIFVVKSAETEAGIEALKKEAKILETLKSPHVVRYLGKNFSKTKNGELELNVLMEFMGGGSLSDIAEKFGGLIKEEVVRLYTREILKGLNYLHRDGIVHGDLKCKNVLVGSSGNVKLADFGFARRIKNFKENLGSDCFRRLTIGGTPLWMAPEVLRNESFDFSSDIWSLGCTVIEMATGSPPWGNKLSSSSPMAAVLKIACEDEKPQFPPFFSEKGRDFLAKCLDRDPERRWTAEKLLNHSFVSGGENGFSGSPASVLEVDAFTVEMEKAPNCRRNPLSRCCEEREKGEVREKEVETEFSFALSSENWITVR